MRNSGLRNLFAFLLQEVKAHGPTFLEEKNWKFEKGVLNLL